MIKKQKTRNRIEVQVKPRLKLRRIGGGLLAISTLAFLAFVYSNFGHRLPISAAEQEMQLLYVENFSDYSCGLTTSSHWYIDELRNSEWEKQEYIFAPCRNRWTAQSIGRERFWYSAPISIGNYHNVTATVSLSEVGNMERSDYIETYYLVDSNNPRLFSINGILKGDFNSQKASVSGIVGTELQIIICVRNNGFRESHYFDDVIVSGQPNVAPNEQ